MKISIITPCLNSEKYIRETVESVLSQKGDFFLEYIVIDGESTDATLSILEKYLNMLREGTYPVHCRGIEFQFFSEKDAGMYDALSKGLEKVTGDIVAYINSDDFYLPNSFSTVSDIFSSYDDVDWLTGMPTCFNEKGQMIETFLPLGYPSGWIQRGLHGTALYYLQQESIFFRTGILNNLDFGKLKTFRYAGDYYIWHSAALHSDLYIVESCIGGFRLREGQLSGNKGSYMEEFFGIAGKRKPFDGISSWVYSKANRYMSNSRKRKVNNRIIHFREGHWVKGAQ